MKRFAGSFYHEIISQFVSHFKILLLNLLSYFWFESNWYSTEWIELTSKPIHSISKSYTCEVFRSPIRMIGFFILINILEGRGMISQTVFVSLGYVTYIVLIVSVGMFVYRQLQRVLEQNEFLFQEKFALLKSIIVQNRIVSSLYFV